MELLRLSGPLHWRHGHCEANEVMVCVFRCLSKLLLCIINKVYLCLCCWKKKQLKTYNTYVGKKKKVNVRWLMFIS